MYHSVFNEIVLLIPTGKFFRRVSTKPGSSEVRVSDRAAPLQLTGIQGLAREHFSREDACQHGDPVWVNQWKYSLPDLYRSQVSKLWTMKCLWESPENWSWFISFPVIFHMFKQKSTDQPLFSSQFHQIKYSFLPTYQHTNIFRNSFRQNLLNRSL